MKPPSLPPFPGISNAEASPIAQLLNSHLIPESCCTTWMGSPYSENIFINKFCSQGDSLLS